ncbi:hypothetical protein [Actinoalloteichus caeruleus]|uniref:hypothetical protein n=1 Tax=Actinoalloteichus cyanogriseus TaxID=2893586 RepID=UPI003AB0CE1D
MRLDRFRELLREQFAAHPGIASVEEYQVPSTTGFAVRFSDGVTIRLRAFATAPPGGDDTSKPEKIVVKSDVG